MRRILCTGIILLICISCNRSKDSDSDRSEGSATTENQFDKSKWLVKEGFEYPYRNQMLDEVVYSDTVRTLSEKEILDLLGKPDRRTDGHFYYTITQKRIGSWPVHTKSMVIKFVNDSTIEWIKIHD